MSGGYIGLELTDRKSIYNKMIGSENPMPLYSQTSFIGIRMCTAGIPISG